MDQVNEGSTSILVLSFVDELGVAVTPNQIEYSVMDKDSNDFVKELTTIDTNLSSTYNLELSSDINTMVNTELLTETRIVTVKATYSGTKIAVQEFRYIIKNLVGISTS